MLFGLVIAERRSKLEMKGNRKSAMFPMEHSPLFLFPTLWPVPVLSAMWKIFTHEQEWLELPLGLPCICRRKGTGGTTSWLSLAIDDSR